MTYDVAICGGGPGGLTAARVLSAVGAKVVVIDEQARAGGQFLRQPPATFRVGQWLKSPLYAAGKSLLREVEAMPGIHWRLGTTIHGLFHELDDGAPVQRLWVSDAVEAGEIHARATIIATGCYDLPAPYPGWTLPGVMTVGGIQTLIKSQQVRPGQKFVLSGSHPLLIVLAEQILDAGGEIVTICLPQSRSAALALLKHPSVVLEHFSKFSAVGRIVLRLIRARVPIYFGAAVTEARGSDQVETVEITHLAADGTPAPGKRWTVSADVVGTSYGFLASSELARQGNAAAVWDLPRGGWLITADPWQQSSKPGLFVVGEVTGVEGADVAMAEGTIAGIACARHLGLIDRATADNLARPARKSLARHRRFARALTALATPPPKLLRALRTDATLVCRCEDLSAGNLGAALATHDFIKAPSALKLLTRVGMGPCQGRMCGHSVIDLMLERGALEPDQPPTGFTPRAPVKPFPLWLAHKP